MVGKLHDRCPPLVRSLCWGHDAWIVGSTAQALVENKSVSGDYDIVVPWKNWTGAALECTSFFGSNSGQNLMANYFGGWKIIDKENIEYDVWPDTLDRYLTQCPIHLRVVAVHPQSGRVIRQTSIMEK